ncbi:MAG: helix-hairpin-helix domain-containing protein [Candidatus Omnitrophota bacterium]
MFHLTSQEKKTVIFVLSLLILGIGLDFYKKKTNKANLVNFGALEEKLFDRVNINKASKSELTTIPGVGEKLAYSIIEYRNSNGDFKNIADLKNIKGIKDKKLEQIKKYITLGNSLN